MDLWAGPRVAAVVVAEYATGWDCCTAGARGHEADGTRQRMQAVLEAAWRVLEVAVGMGMPLVGSEGKHKRHKELQHWAGAAVKGKHSSEAAGLGCRSTLEAEAQYEERGRRRLPVEAACSGEVHSGMIVSKAAVAPEEASEETAVWDCHRYSEAAPAVEANAIQQTQQALTVEKEVK